MPLVIIVGCPCAGKTALALRDLFSHRTAKNCVIINEEGLGISERNGYKGDYLVVFHSKVFV